MGKYLKSVIDLLSNAGYTPEDIACILGVSIQTINTYLTKENNCINRPNG